MNWKQVEKLKFTDEEMEIINFYCKDEMRELKRICNIIINKKYIDIDKEYYDDLYSDALIVLMESTKDYNGNKASFRTYLTGNINRSFIDWFRDNCCRAKRKPLLLDSKGRIVKMLDENGNEKPVYLKTVSFDEPIDRDEYSLIDTVPGKMDVKEDDFEYSKQMKEYLSRLSKLQRKILDYLIKGYSQEEIQEILHISSNSYRDNFKNIMDEKNLKIIRVLIGGR